jgi:hypothetical protein
MKKELTILACMLIAPLAFGQASADGTTQGPRTQVNTRMVGPGKVGTVETFNGSNITVAATAMTHPIKYRVAKDVHFDNASGGALTADSVRAGTRVQLGFNNEGQVDRITLLDLR